MKRDIEKLSSQQFDVLVIGGGINGAAIANMASINGLSVALVEKRDFASGTSSKSSKLVHGGLRYLENFEFDLVGEALFERHIQLKSAPHLVRPLGFIFPVYKTDPKPVWLVRLGISVYDFLCGRYLIKKNRPLSAEEIIAFVPEIKREGLVGGVLYFDAQMDDARLCLENVLNAAHNGACIANYVEVRALNKLNGKIVGVQAIDKISGAAFDVKAKKVVCAVGAWTNEFIIKENSRAPSKVRTTKGVHVIYRGQACEHAIVLPTLSDKRVLFLIPFMGNTLIGTTDTDYEGPLDDVNVEESDIEYIFKEAARAFPDLSFSPGNIITTFAGLRPLVHREGSPAKVSRKHVIEQSYTGMIYVMGGKYTTYRKIAEDCVKMLTNKKLVDTTEMYPLYGGGAIDVDVKAEAENYGVEEETLAHLLQAYGSRYLDVLALAQQDKALKRKIISELPQIWAEVAYAKEVEMAQTADDIFDRRLGLVYLTSDVDKVKKELEGYLNK